MTSRDSNDDVTADQLIFSCSVVSAVTGTYRRTGVPKLNGKRSATVPAPGRAGKRVGDDKQLMNGNDNLPERQTISAMV
jgi:hypothetical protein